MAEINYNFADDETKHAYIQTFWDNFFPMLEKKMLSRRNGRTKVEWKKSVSINSRYGIKNLCTLRNGNKWLRFSVEVYPWIWSEGTLFVLIKYEDSKKLAVPTKFILPKEQGAVWKPNFNVFFLLTNTESVLRYIQSIELTALDVGLFQTIQKAVEKLIGK